MAVKKNSSNMNYKKKRSGTSSWLYVLLFIAAIAGGAYFAYSSNEGNDSGNVKKPNVMNAVKNASDANGQPDADKLTKDDKNADKQSSMSDNTPLPAARIYGAGKGKMAIIIDDFGYNGDVIEKFVSIDKPLTFAVLPYKQFSKEALRRGLASNHSVILHLPMETLDGSSSEDSAVMVRQNDDEIRAKVQKMLESLPGVTGVNNHQGSKATADKRVMRDVLMVIKDKGMFFVDSRTNAGSVAEGMAEKLNVKTGANALFLDNSADVASVKRQLREAMRMSAQKGDVIVIGHARANTAEAIKEMLPELEKNGIVLVRASNLVR